MMGDKLNDLKRQVIEAAEVLEYNDVLKLEAKHPVVLRTPEYNIIIERYDPPVTTSSPPIMMPRPQVQDAAVSY